MYVFIYVVSIIYVALATLHTYSYWCGDSVMRKSFKRLHFICIAFTNNSTLDTYIAYSKYSYCFYIIKIGILIARPKFAKINLLIQNPCIAGEIPIKYPNEWYIRSQTILFIMFDINFKNLVNIRYICTSIGYIIPR